MRAKSHRYLARYLAQRYMPHAPRRYVRAFELGCVEPDKNPVTYLKGSVRRQWLRGHNYGNARRYMHRLCRRLEQKPRLRLLDYYSMGKLIHYTTDAFTYAHNDLFPANLAGHREYEQRLQEHFLRYLNTHPAVQCKDKLTLMESIRAYHREYIRQPAGIHTDAKYALSACTCVLEMLMAQDMH